MKYLRFQSSKGLTSDLFTSEGDFIGGKDAETEAAHIASVQEALEAAYDTRLTPVTGEADPWDGKASLVKNPHAARKAAQAAHRAAQEEYEAAVAAELRLMAEERLAGKGITLKG